MCCNRCDCCLVTKTILKTILLQARYARNHQVLDSHRRESGDVQPSRLLSPSSKTVSRKSTQWTKHVLYTNISKPIPINIQTLQCIQFLKSPAAIQLLSSNVHLYKLHSH
ncbi:unnamed protein product [Microthlaspi erraticum]|uniref:Uncharacterized protein n=1 Tax=Microthlaspi erraticum TaxID=1685480 RepID=A0A6D2JVE4_9BRAS|nr:unnamed protein product [Microthlaspi erraticum]